MLCAGCTSGYGSVLEDTSVTFKMVVASYLYLTFSFGSKHLPLVSLNTKYHKSVDAHFQINFNLKLYFSS